MYSLGPTRTLLASFLFCDRPITGDVRGSGDTAPLSAFRVGSVAAERSYRVCGSSYLVRQCIPVEPQEGGGGGPIPQYFPIRPSSLTFILCLVPLFLYFTKKRPFIGLTRHLIGQFLHHVISGNIKRRPWFMNYYNNTINCLT